jgi:hypothetical protein
VQHQALRLSAFSIEFCRTKHENSLSRFEWPWERTLNVSDLYATLQAVITADRNAKTGQNLAALVQAYQNLQSQPGNNNFQQQVANALQNVLASIDASNIAGSELEKRFPGQKTNALFDDRLADEVRGIVTLNAATPSVISQRLNEISSARMTILNEFHSTIKTANDLGLSKEFVGASDTQIGFIIPRSYFSNTAEGLSKEIRHLDFIMKVFSKLAIGEVETPTVATLSTSDPSLFFHLAPHTIHLIVKGVETAINIVRSFSDTVKALEIIRKTLPGAKTEDMGSELDAKVKALVNERVAELLKEAEVSVKKPNAQLEAELNRAVTLLVEHISGGVTVRVLAGPPNPDSSVDDAEKYEAERQAILASAAKLSFPPHETAEIKLLTQSDDPQ